MAELKDISIRNLEYKDCASIAEAFRGQGWDKPEDQFVAYFQEQDRREREVFVGRVKDEFAGYTTVVWNSQYPPFSNDAIPEIVDLNVLMKFQRRGVGNRLVDAAEAFIAERSGLAGVRVGLTADYAAAHRLYIKRGYLPDDHGISYQSRSLKYGESAIVDDELTIGFIKEVQGKTE